MRWRLLLCGPQSGARNMAVDEALLQGVQQGTSVPTLRLYSWSPGCYSVGRFQKASDLNERARAVPGDSWVRRPTGGRALYHGPELTYSVTAGLSDDRVSGTVLQSYRKVAEALLAGLMELGVSAQLAPRGDAARARSSPSCFDSPSDSEVLWQGRKLIGSAQQRGAEALLQHGSLLLESPTAELFDGLAFASVEERERARAEGESRLATLTQALGYAPDLDRVAHAVARGFERCWRLEFDHGRLSDHEEETAQVLEREKYRQVDWCYRR